MARAFEELRFKPEHQLIDELFDRFGIEDLIRHYEKEQAGPHYEYVMSSQLQLTPLLAPRLCGLLDQVCEGLDFAEPLELYVASDPNVNAFALHSLGEDQPHVLSVTSGLVERTSDDELRFVLGHELGHLAFRHYRAMLVHAAVGEDERGNSRMPSLLKARLSTWARLGELSADRVGFAAVGGDLDAAVSTFFKLASGLGPEHLKFDIAAFIAQLEGLQKMKRREVMAAFSHPVTPVRVRALQLYGEAGGEAASAEGIEGVDTAVDELARLLEYEVTKPLGVHALEFLLAGGLLAAHADGSEIDDDQRDVLIELILPLSSDPETQFRRVETTDQAHEMLNGAAEWLRENSGEERYELFRELAHVVSVDGRLHPGELELMQRIAKLLEIPEKAATEMCYDVLSTYLQMERRHTSAPFGLQRG